MNTSGMLRDDAFKGKTILITGGGTGLGKSMGKYFLELGANLVIASRKADKLFDAELELESATGGQVFGFPCDVKDYVQVENLLEESYKVFGGVDVVINNAAGNFISPTERLSNRAFDSIVDIVLRGSYHTTLAFGKKWIKEKREGVFLNIVTTYAATGSGYVVPSAAAKGGVLALTKSIAAEWAKYKIRANAIAPGPFPTEGAWSRLVPEGLEKIADWTSRVPLGRTGDHQELANLAAFLISDFSSFITGECIAIDGGETIYNAGQFSFLDKVPHEMWDEIEKKVREANKK